MLEKVLILVFQNNKMKTMRIMKMKKNRKNWNPLVQKKKSRLVINYKKLLLLLRINFIS